MNPQVQAIVNSLTNFTIPVSQEQIPLIVVAALSATVSLTTLSTSDREQVVIDVVQYYVTNSNIPASDQTVIMTLVPGIIDVLVDLPQAETFCTSVGNWFKSSCSCCC